MSKYRQRDREMERQTDRQIATLSKEDVSQECQAGGEEAVEVLRRGHLEGLPQVPLGLADVVGEVGLERQINRYIYKHVLIRSSFQLNRYIDRQIYTYRQIDNL